jgi:type IV pilus assembly protein PilW
MRKTMNLSVHLRNQKGLTLVELMIALSVGLLLFAGVLTVFVGMRTTTVETSSYGELQENGRFAVSVLTEDILRQGFWGDFSNSNLRGIPVTVPAIANDCIGGGINNASLPQGLGNFREIWGQTVEPGSPDPLGCFGAVANTQTRINSDIIQLKRAISQPIAVANLNADDIYLYANYDEAKLFSNNVVPPLIANGRYWQYQHHVYYVRERTVGNNTVPVLMQGRLVNRRMNFNPIIDGIEMIRFMYGLDVNDDGNVDSYLNAASVSENAWDDRILTIKMFVLARNIRPDRKYINTNTYQLGDLAFPVNDNFRRLLFSSTVNLYNNGTTNF